MQFMEEVQPYRLVPAKATRLSPVTETNLDPSSVWASRTLQHPALLQCLAQCSEVTPYLLVMEFCPLVWTKTFFFRPLLFAFVASRNSPNSLSVLVPGRREELPARLSADRLRDPRPVAPAADGVRHRLRASAPPQKQLCSQVRTAHPSISFVLPSLVLLKRKKTNPSEFSLLPLLDSPCNNILVLPESLSQTPASVILLPGANSSHNYGAAPQ